ncbi:hypothetical protein F4821DRAFT_281756 [Hypoxylon rubiginosum]|uniref:Uncharacterized protein n=1 Tax=Hypoxylon rubiginosum TaxID=110542 RepID=A0ACC0CQ22_9PEZI|nr:hypothetical protein F4821DRAFT_281756 [Hypoxylon rubiginosum]
MSKPIPIPPRKDSVKQDPEEIDWDAERTKWSETDDNILRKAVADYGVNNWDNVAKMLWTRKDAKQCRARWAELAPILQARMARKYGRKRSTTSPALMTSPALTSTGQSQQKTYFQPSSSEAEMIRQIEASEGILSTPTTIPIPKTNTRKKSRMQPPPTPMDSPLLNPIVSPVSKTPPPPTPPLTPPPPTPPLTPPPRPPRMPSAALPLSPRTSTVPTTPTTATKKRFPSLLSLLPLSGRDRSQSAPTPRAPMRLDSTPVAQAPETPDSNRTSISSSRSSTARTSAEQEWSAPHPLMPGTYYRSSMSFRYQR